MQRGGPRGFMERMEEWKSKIYLREKTTQNQLVLNIHLQAESKKMEPQGLVSGGFK